MLACGIVASIAFVWAEEPEEQLRASCVAMIKDRLVTPEPFEVHEITGPYRSRATWDDYNGWGDRAKFRWDQQLLERSDGVARGHALVRRIFSQMEEPTLIEIFVKYTGNRRVQGVITRTSMCTIVTDGDALPDGRQVRQEMRVDYFTDLEYASYRVYLLSR